MTGKGEDDAAELILVADDDEDVLNLICMRLEHVGYDVARATDGTEAVRIATELRPSLCVFDVQMPGMTGYEVIERLRADGSMDDIPMILLTASVQERDMARGYEVGADAYMRKPFNPRELVARIETLLPGR